MSIRIAMWSGPRNLSTAMMRAFENRADCTVWDEPFYAAYLSQTGIEHPMRAEILASGETDPARVARACADGAGQGVHYQKHMTHHMQPGWSEDWFHQVHHAFLIRAPERVLASYAAKREAVSLNDIGFVQQARIFDQLFECTGTPPPVIEAEDMRRSPATLMPKLCDALGIAFDPAMLHWPAGLRTSDGVWASHWYGAVETSTGFTPPPDDALPTLGAALQAIADAARPAFDKLRAHKITP